MIPAPHDIRLLVETFGQGRFAEARALALQCTQRYPAWAPGWKVLGAAFTQLGQTSDAIKAMQIAANLAPGDPEIHSNLGAVLLELGRVDEAAQCCRRALKIKPDLSTARNNLGIALIDLDQRKEAEASLRRAIEIDPRNASAWFNLHALLTNRDNLEPAIECLENSLAIEPQHAERRFFLGFLNDYAGNSEAAAGMLRVDGLPALEAKLDAWKYLKAAADPLPAIAGVAAAVFDLAFLAAPPNGLVLEFGVRFGTSIRQIAARARQEVHGFDSFVGLPEDWHGEGKGTYSTSGILPKVPRNVRLHAGWFHESLPGFLERHPGPVRLMNVDCDLYSSTKTVLDLLAERLVPGSIIVFDEYIGNPNWRDDEFKAFQEAAGKYGWAYRYLAFSFFSKQVVVQID